MIRAWQEVRKGFRFIRPGFDQYGYLKAATDSLKREKKRTCRCYGDVLILAGQQSLAVR